MGLFRLGRKNVKLSQFQGNDNITLANGFIVSVNSVQIYAVLDN